MLTMFFHKCLTQQYKNILTQYLWRGFENIFRFLRVFTRFKLKRTLEDMEHLLRMRHLIEVMSDSIEKAYIQPFCGLLTKKQLLSFCS